MKKPNVSKIVKNSSKEKLTPIGGRTSFYFQDISIWDDFRDICDKGNLSYSAVIGNFVKEFNELNK